NSLVQDRAVWGQVLAEVYAALPSPPEQVVQAMAGGLGQPGVYDDADRQAITSIPRNQRTWVQVERLDSVYTHQIADVVNAGNFIGAAEAALAQKNREGFQGASIGEIEPVADPITLDDNARGFVVRMVVSTPLPYQEAIHSLGRCDNPLRNRLFAIQPSPQRPNMPFG